MTRPLLALALLCGTPAALAAQDLPPLGEVPVITEGLINTAIAYELDRKCDELEGRRLQGIAFLWSLESEARRLGYSRQEIQAFIDNEAEKDRLEAIARERLRGMGAVEGQWDTYCAVGRAEIAKDSPIGALLDD
ncbi:MAG TPA: DUF5333 domain-containing protein [Rubellimicrobium sp.]|jgi:hypothetical protein|nr:DUF5333 domain-containing protein [Rubellimicrobium sp.]